jgi:SagB-type dehydrogenase family enzyme
MLEEVEARTSRRRGAPASHSRASVEDCILRRRSARGFADRPLSRETLEWIIEAAAGGRTTRATDVSLLLAVHRVSGLAAGRYGVREGRGLVAERPGDLRGPLVRACLGQRKAGTCAVAFFIVGDIERARSMRGDRSYRDLLIESGAIAQRIYLAAEAAGLAARNLAAFRDDAVNRLLELDGDVRPALHLTLVGYEDPRASKAP